MAVTISLPQVGESVVEGTIGKWLKQPGEKVERFEALVEVVTDKVTVEVPSPVSGSLIRWLAQEGETIPTGAPIAEMESADAPPATSHAAPAPASSSAPTAASPERPAGTIGYLVKDVKQVGPTGGGSGEETPPASGSPVAAPPAAWPAVQPAETAALNRDSGESPRLSPAVRRLAQEHQVDVARVHGSGLGGRVTKSDVLRYVEQRGAAPAPQAPAAPAAPIIPAMPAGPDEEIMPLPPVRRMIAEAMQRSVSQIPHAWSMIEVDVTGLVALRQRVRAEFARREGVDLTYLPFILQIVAAALRENPTLNATWGGDKIILKRRVNIGVAVAAHQGLVVPVLPDADRLSLSGLAHALNDITQRARENKLTLADVQGGTFTLNNTGALGSIASQPIINYPQAAILTTEAIQKRPVVVAGDAIAIRSMMNLCLSFDHRINDGAEASAFLQSVKRRLEALKPDTAV